MTGAIVESAPTDNGPVEPKTAIASEPTMNAARPAVAGIPASRAVAICSGMAIAASSRPASSSGPSER